MAIPKGILPNDLQEKIKESKVLVVGAGGIGCEVIKNLVMSGFPYIEIIDLDTIDLSNLNRQFLFHREHIGKSKALIARETAMKFNPNVEIISHHNSITSLEFGVNFFKKFSVVLNALDNRAARNHVNRMCLNAEVPLIESGTAAYNGQVELIHKGLTECYECTPKPKQRTFPGCTIRNTPSELIHCIVWAKHLFNQLFGEVVDAEDISPDVEDPEAKRESADDASKENRPESGNILRINTREWAKNNNYDPATLFNKFFYDDIKYLLTMSNLWKTRKSPASIKWDSVLIYDVADVNAVRKQNFKIWSLAECAAIFADCLKNLAKQLTAENGSLIWDKDDVDSMDFVGACANIRAYIFGISRKSCFDVKAMAGNIIPAIATTNAITAGIVVMRAFNVLQKKYDKCQSVFVRLRPNPRNQVFVPERSINPPNPKCYVCTGNPAVQLRIDTKRMTIKAFRDEVLIKGLNMVDPDVIVDAKGLILISSEEGETDENNDKLLHEMDIVDGVLLKCDDFFQNYQLSIVIVHFDSKIEPFFEICAGETPLKPTKEQPNENPAHMNGAETDLSGPSSSKKMMLTEEANDIAVIDDNDDDDLRIVEDDANEKVFKSTDAITAAVTAAAKELTVSSTTATHTATGKHKAEAMDITQCSDDELSNDGDDEDDESMNPSARKRTRLER